MKDNSKKGINRREFLGSLAASALYVTGNQESHTQYIPSDEYHETVLNYGRTDGNNLPRMPKDKYFSVGYNPTHGRVDVMESNGVPYFEGKVPIQGLLSKLKSEKQETINSEVEDFIMKSYHNYWDLQNSPGKHISSSTPVLKVLTNKL